jgi:hypothetical protein
MLFTYSFIITGVSFIFCFFFAGGLAKEMRAMGIVDVSRNIVSIPGLIKYIRKKQELNEPFSKNFYGTLISFLMIFTPFLVGGIFY